MPPPFLHEIIRETTRAIVRRHFALRVHPEPGNDHRDAVLSGYDEVRRIDRQFGRLLDRLRGVDRPD